MTYICIRCRNIWINGNPTNDYSGGLCLACIKEYIRVKQKRQGFHDCFKRAIEVCSKGDCHAGAAPRRRPAPARPGIERRHSKPSLENIPAALVSVPARTSPGRTTRAVDATTGPALVLELCSRPNNRSEKVNGDGRLWRGGRNSTLTLLG